MAKNLSKIKVKNPFFDPRSKLNLLLRKADDLKQKQYFWCFEINTLDDGKYIKEWTILSIDGFSGFNSMKEAKDFLKKFLSGKTEQQIATTIMSSR